MQDFFELAAMAAHLFGRQHGNVYAAAIVIGFRRKIGNNKHDYYSLKQQSPLFPFSRRIFHLRRSFSNDLYFFAAASFMGIIICRAVQANGVIVFGVSLFL